jgi:hypothetical protein
MRQSEHDASVGEARVPGSAEDGPTPSHQRADFNDPLPAGDPTAPGAPHEPGGDAFRQSTTSSPGTSHALEIGDRQKGRPADKS